jgi:hypothetical protein
MSWDNHLSKILKGGSAQHFFSGTKDGKPLTPTNWVQLLNGRKSGKLHMHGLGLHHGWILEDDAIVAADQIAKLRNENAYPVITTVSCFTGEFDRGKDPCIAEAMIRRPKAGAVAVVAPVREGKPDATSRTMTQFWEQGLSQNVSAGAAMMLVKAGLAAGARESAFLHLCACELNLLGDPTLSLRGTAPRTPKVAGPGELPAGNLSLIIESDAPHSMVALQDSFGLYAVQVSDESGNVTFPLNVVKDSTITITVSGPQYNAVTLKIPVR